MNPFHELKHTPEMSKNIRDGRESIFTKNTDTKETTLVPSKLVLEYIFDQLDQDDQVDEPQQRQELRESLLFDHVGHKNITDFSKRSPQTPFLPTFTQYHHAATSPPDQGKPMFASFLSVFTSQETVTANNHICQKKYRFDSDTDETSRISDSSHLSSSDDLSEESFTSKTKMNQEKFYFSTHYTPSSESIQTLDSDQEPVSRHYYNRRTIFPKYWKSAEDGRLRKSMGNKVT
mmetsp:Transcript_23210/g.46322  ORF Transcript_23210/g.46322 Transcript_23210/m.46322 type:complete len:233 (+) Transcript_23210:98-796(+)